MVLPDIPVLVVGLLVRLGSLDLVEDSLVVDHIAVVDRTAVVGHIVEGVVVRIDLEVGHHRIAVAEDSRRQRHTDQEAGHRSLVEEDRQ